MLVRGAQRPAGHWGGDRTQTTLWQIPAREDDGHGHGTQKPVECMRRPIDNNTRRVRRSTIRSWARARRIIAAEMTGRACLAIEINPVYVDVAITRWQNFTGEKATKKAAASAAA